MGEYKSTIAEILQREGSIAGFYAVCLVERIIEDDYANRKSTKKPAQKSVKKVIIKAPMLNKIAVPAPLLKYLLNTSVATMNETILKLTIGMVMLYIGYIEHNCYV